MVSGSFLLNVSHKKNTKIPANTAVLPNKKNGKAAKCDACNSVQNVLKLTKN